MDEGSSFDFAAPQFLESLSEAATLAEMDGADSYFETAITHNIPVKLVETPPRDGNMETFYTPCTKESCAEQKEELRDKPKEIPRNGPVFQENKVSAPKNFEERSTKKTRSFSAFNNKNLHFVREEKKHLTYEGIQITIGVEKQHGMLTRQDKILKSPTLELRSRQIVRGATKRKASPLHDEKCFRMNCSPEFIPLAEKVMRFQVGTPPRFKSKICSQEDKENKNILLKPTVPISPNLYTKSRSRPVEIENPEGSKYVFKANKLNLKIFGKPAIGERPKPKSPTVPKPFNLKEISKKELPKKELFHFKARPMPKFLKDPINVLDNSDQRKKRMPLCSDLEDVYSGMPSVHDANPTTQIKPFSFDERDKEILRKKEQKIKKLQEEVGKMPLFQAAPVPTFISNTSLRSAHSTLSLASNCSSVKGLRSSNLENSNTNETSFKAKFPSVLYKEPFIPQKCERPPIEPTNFELCTEKRARERHEFEKELKLREERQELERKEIVTYLEQMEKEKISELRKNLVHKALPLPHYLESKKDILKQS